MLVVHLGGLLEDRPGLKRRFSRLLRTLDLAYHQSSAERETVFVSYIIQLFVILVEPGERHPEGVRLPRGFHSVHRLHSFSVGVYYLHTNNTD